MKATDSITNDQDSIDSRDVIARIEFLEEERAEIVDDIENAGDDAEQKEAEEDALKEWDDDNGDELKALKALAEECDGVDDWKYGAQLIRESYFETAMDEMLEDCGDLPKNLPCYLRIEVDYKALLMDYTSVEFGDVTYYVR